MKSWAVDLPNSPVQFLSLDEVLAIQKRLIDGFGGQHGVRDPGLLESALFRPQTGYYSHLEEMAAALFESLLFNQAFVDGKKRIAFFSTDVFLRLNGWKLQVSAEEGESFMINILKDSENSLGRILSWVRQSIVAN